MIIRSLFCNPVRAGMVERPEDYPWSSYRANALCGRDPLRSPHPRYLALGAEAAGRPTAYRRLFETHLDPDLVRNLRASLQSGAPLGNDRCRARIEQALGVRVGCSTPGRPEEPPAEAALG
jgi:putative transposase